MTRISHLGFVFEIKDRKKLEHYIQLLQRIALVELEHDRWRASTIPPKTDDPWVPANIGHVNKLENEGIVSRKYVSNNITYYELQINPEELLEEVREAAETLSIDLEQASPYDVDDLPDG